MLPITLPLLTILASAGSGKTYQLSNRIISFLAHGESARDVVALTFTRKAAGEFTDALLSKLAKAADSSTHAAALDQEIQTSADTNYLDLLARLVRDLPHLRFGTLDSFFLHVVTQFQYEFGIAAGRVSLIDETQQELLLENTINAYISSIADNEAEPLLRAFQRACKQKPLATVRATMLNFVKEWLPHYQNDDTTRRWGLIEPSQHGEAMRQWQDNRDAMVAHLRAGIDTLDLTDKRLTKSLDTLCMDFAKHSIGSGSINGSSLFAQFIEHFNFHTEMDNASEAKLIITYYKKDFDLTAIREPLRQLILSAAAAEIDNASQSTHAIHELITYFDQLWQQRFRSQGQLRFSDLQQLMSSWKHSELQRLTREQIDYRLTQSYRHWLLDEFQDTSTQQWQGIDPLISGGVENNGSLFVVGDRKQAIYAWRGGDVSLFDTVRTAYEPLGMKFMPMARSFRSCPQVLDFVNHVFGDPQSLGEFFNDVGREWPWQNHQSARPDVRGHCKVEVVDCGDTSRERDQESPVDDDAEDADGSINKIDARIERMIADMRQLGLPESRLHCGVLVRSNRELQQVSFALRQAGFSVVEEGNVSPGRDNPIGVSITELVRWLANPADRFALELLKMSPLGAALQLDTQPHRAWHQATEKIAAIGWSRYLATMITTAITLSEQGISDFGQQRLNLILQSLRALETQPELSHHVIATQIDRLLTSAQNGAAAIQVLTIHKSKGLGFDAVFLPLISSEKIPNLRHYNYSMGSDWLCMRVPEWVRSLNPQLREAQSQWERASLYEALCVLYVSLTRSKRGLYLYLKKPTSKSNTKEVSRSIASFLLSKNETAADENPVIFERGSFADLLPHLSAPANMAATATAASPDLCPLDSPPPLAEAVPRPARHQPSAHARTEHVTRSSGAIFGSKIHALLEPLRWPQASDFDPQDEHGAYLHHAFSHPAFQKFFAQQPQVEVMMEINIDGVIAAQHSRGIIDRLHLHRRHDGSLERVEIIDYKTDALVDPAALIERHAPQLNIYRELMARALPIPCAEIRCYLIALHTQQIIEVPPSL